ncbi:maf-like protein DDB_G0281937 isoform X2 [Abrus precatorius]|uniref:Maf-like protein DDB_G0281937 isoform X2 n=1 Tax=Abrus precatorius TaxID=3816 RepID=A0A8B8JTJ3_ABRPR|nr:maf-like protein DDB_G0281937 isoform X2 [Abrus precatorius]
MEASTSSYKIILGSSSIARRKILSEMGYEFTTMTADIDEKSIRKETPEELVMALAEAKAEAILQRLPLDDYLKDAKPTLLITSDQVVVYEGVIREKPSSKEEARQFLKDYSGRHAATVGSVLVTNLKTGFRKGEWDRVEICVLQHFWLFEPSDASVDKHLCLLFFDNICIEFFLYLQLQSHVVMLHHSCFLVHSLVMTWKEELDY